METLFPLLFGSYVFLGLFSLFLHQPTLMKMLGKFFFLAGMFFVGGFIYLMFVDGAPLVGTPVSLGILIFALWRAYQW